MNDLRISQRVDVRTAEPPATSLDPGASCGSVPGLSRHDHGLRQAATPVGDVMTGRRNILLVDDSDPVRETLADLLEVEGFQTAQAASAAEAMTLLRQDPGFDVLVTDLSMPGEDGISWQLVFDPGVDRDDPAVRAAASAYVNQARAELGL